VLVELRTLRSLLTPLIEATGPQPAVPSSLAATGPQPAVPPLPRRQPGQERPGIPHQRAHQPGDDVVGATEGTAESTAEGTAEGQENGLLAGEGELLRLADSEEAWW